MNEYTPGDRVAVKAQFFNEEGQVVDPGSVTLYVINASQEMSTVETVRVINQTPPPPSLLSSQIAAFKNFQIGPVYVGYIDTTNGTGTWWYRFVSTSPNQAAKEQCFTVKSTVFS